MRGIGTGISEQQRLLWLLLAISIVAGVASALSPFYAAGGFMFLLAVAVGSLVIARYPYWLVLFLAAYIPFEDFALKFLPVSTQVVFVLQFIGEFLIYCAFGILVIQVLLKGGTLRKTPVDIPLALFVVIALLSLVLNQAPLFGSLVNIRALLRYSVLFYLVANLDLTSKQVNRILIVILFVGLVQVLIGGLQLATNGAINQLLIPRPTGIEVAGMSRGWVLLRRGREIGSIFGTLGDTIFFALFLLIVFAIQLGRLKTLSISRAGFLAVTFFAIGYAFARAVVFASILMLVVFARIRFGLNRLLLAFLLLLPLCVAGIATLANSSFLEREFVNPIRNELSIVENLTGVFSIEYFQRAQNQRLGALLGIPPTVLWNRPFLGYGPDEDTTIDRLNESQPSFLFRTVTKRGFEDVYWVAILAYYGIGGPVAIAWLLVNFYSAAKKVYKVSTKNLTQEVALTVMFIACVTPFLLFFYRVLEFRSYSFYFWLIPALMISLCNEEREHISSENSKPYSGVK